MRAYRNSSTIKIAEFTDTFSGIMAAMHRNVIAFGTMLILALLAWFWPQKTFRTKLGPGESLLKAAFADESSEEGTRSGRLCLTSSRLVYGIHLGYSGSTDLRGGGGGRMDNIETAEWPLNSISKVEDCSNGPSPEKVRIILRDGQECRFTVTSNSAAPKWAMAIEGARKSFR